MNCEEYYLLETACIKAGADASDVYRMAVAEHIYEISRLRENNVRITKKVIREAKKTVSIRCLMWFDNALAEATPFDAAYIATYRISALYFKQLRLDNERNGK